MEVEEESGGGGGGSSDSGGGGGEVRSSPAPHFLHILGTAIFMIL